MYVVLGATGHVGSAVTEALLACDQPVTIVSRTAERAEPFRARGARVASADVHDVATLRRTFEGATRVFLLNPPADPATDTDVEERKTVRAILSALEGSGVTDVVALSTYAAQPGDALGDLAVLYELEQGLAALPLRATIVRGAYYFTNWDHALASARADGTVPTFFPADFVLPMVAPRDIGRVAAELMMQSEQRPSIHHVEGPARSSPADVARAFSTTLRRDVAAVTIPREGWVDALTSLGFSAKAARSFAAMTDAAIRTAPPDPRTVTRGTTTLDEHVAELARRTS